MFSRKKPIVDAAAVGGFRSTGTAGTSRTNAPHLTTHAVLECDMDGTVLTATAHFAELVGYTVDELKGMRQSALLDATANEAYGQAWSALRRDGQERSEHQFRAKDGTPRWLHLVSTVVPATDPRVARVVMFATDITALRTALKDVSDELKVRSATS